MYNATQRAILNYLRVSWMIRGLALVALALILHNLGVFSTMHADAATPSSGATTTLKRVRDTEVDLASRLAAIHAATESALSSLRNDAEKAVRAAAVEAERSREAAITAARSRLETDAAKIETDGRTEAERIESSKEFDLARLRAPLLKAVLQGFDGESEP